MAHRTLKIAHTARLLLLPYLLVTLLLVVIPALGTLALAFTRYNAVQPPEWVGLQNFVKLAQSPLVAGSLRSSLLFLLAAVPLRLVIALVSALLLQHHAYRRYRAAALLPTLIPESAYALLWLWILNPLYGPLNGLLSLFGLPPYNWLAEPALAIAAIVLLLTFQFGEGFLIALSGLQTIPTDLYEAAKVDGASRAQIFWRITLPLLVPWLLLMLFRDLLVSLQSTFTPSFMLTYGGPYYATTFIPLLIYELSFDLLDLGMAAALLVLTALMLSLFAFGVWNLLSPQEARADG
ncbi:MAG: sugar ABC transporter permease [Anaerolineales bacterium]